MTLQILAPIFLFTLTAAITPGGATTLATASGLQYGLARSIPLIIGIAFGMVSLSVAASAGLASLMLTSPSLHLLLKVAGTIYLLWLAFMIARSNRPKPRDDLAKPISFFGSLGLLWLNPKAWAMTMGAAASFSALITDPLHLAFWLGLAFGISAIFSMSLWCSTGSLLARLLKTDRQWKVVNIVLGLLLAASIMPIWLF
ncbi:LysE family translocator [Thalassospira sp. TSL5-1]|uniref:LysE family translocator n=1 Tax=Thalassospira sp. TSL5-1 TaxID=1544451 RepID=UPI00093C6793|nr:LysE family translocator [Thalassospira sp. TSL5-1]OKH89551.1 amino acid transporter [Thalassospira sp. TSL5-1]